MRRLVAVLASPPLTSGQRTMRQLHQAQGLLDCDEVVVANLFALPAQDLPALSQIGSDPDAWIMARPQLAQVLNETSVLLAAWGLPALSGAAAGHHRRQLVWFREQAEQRGHHLAWTVGGQPRHPSRWHQYMSDRHARTSGGSPQERLRQALELQELVTLTG